MANKISEELATTKVYSNGFYFPGLATGLLSVAAYIFKRYHFDSYLIPGLLAGLALLISISSKHGIEISFERNAFRSYVSYLGIKTGKWQSLEDWHFLSLFETNYLENANNIDSNNRASRMEYEVVLLNESHSKKQILLSLALKERAEVIIEELSAYLAYPRVAYDPPRRHYR